MKIVYMVVKGMPYGAGIEKYTEEIGSWLVKRGHEVVVYSMRGNGVKDGSVYRGMKIKTVPAINSKSLQKLSASFFSSVKQLMEPDCDIVHFHAFGPAMFSFLPRLRGRKVVVQGHGLEWKRSRWGLGGRLFLKFTEAPSVAFPHVLTVVSNVQREYIKKKYGKESVYIPTGVNPPKMRKPSLIKKRWGLSERNYILFAARLVPEKGAHYLVEAYRSAKPEGLKLVIAGDAPHEEEYKKRLKNLAGGDGDIIFTGHASGETLEELFSNPYLFVLPSEIEGLPTALLEAMSYGNACLVSDIPENIEALNSLGFTFKSKDPVDLAERLKDLSGASAKVDKLRPKAKKYVLENFSWDNIAKEFEKLYRKALAN